MRLLILTQKVDMNDPDLGFFHRWIEEFARQCESVIVICLYEGSHTLPKNVRVLSLGKESGLSRMKYLRRFFWYIWKEREQYDVVFVHMNQIYVTLGGLFWRMWHKRIGLWYAHGAVSLSLRIATLFSQRIFTSTDDGFRIKSSKKRLVGQGIDTSLFTQKEDYKIGDVFRLVTFGRVMPVKDIEGMIDSVAALSKRKIPATLDVIGSGEQSYIEELQELARTQGVEGRIVFKGGMPYRDITKTIGAYDAFINLGRTGSLDKALLDAAAAGLPIVTTNPAFRGIGTVTNNPIEALVDLHATDPLSRQSAAQSLATVVSREHSLDGLVKRIIAEYLV